MEFQYVQQPIPEDVEEYTQELGEGLSCTTIVGRSYIIICIKNEVDDTKKYYHVPKKYL